MSFPCNVVDVNAYFELNSVEFVYTPYVTDSWSATSKFWIEKDSGTLGGKIKASYDFNVGWDYLSAKVAYYDPSYSLMVAKIKTYGDETSGMPERFGLSPRNFTITPTQK